MSRWRSSCSRAIALERACAAICKKSCVPCTEKSERDSAGGSKLARAKARLLFVSVVQPGTSFTFQTGRILYTLVRFLGLFVIHPPAVVVPVGRWESRLLGISSFP